ncbi:MAG: tRNA pseudouridine(38-40) synthase TruA [Candidatus Omnitrophota bacterium]
MISPNVRHQYVGGFRRRLPGTSASQRNIRLQIEYDGTNYAGWQLQSSRKKKTIQQVLEKTLRKILQEKIHLIVSGRTDSGVHALAQVANFKTSSKIPADRLRYALNGNLPADIVVSAAHDAALGFHSQFSAKSKAYRYCILNRPYPSALLRQGAYFYPHHLDTALMHKEARCLLGRHDFASFCASGSSVKTTIRTIKRISIRQAKAHQAGLPPGLLIIEIEGDGFLYNMVRNIAGTLIEIGRGRFGPGYLKKLLQAKNRKLAGPTAPARGLYLVEVNY